MNISDDFLSSHNFMTLPPQNNTLPQIYDFLQICAIRCLGSKLTAKNLFYRKLSEETVSLFPVKKGSAAT